MTKVIHKQQVKPEFIVTYGYSVFENGKKVREANFADEKEWVFALYKEGYFEVKK